jgi:hypothetical protein
MPYPTQNRLKRGRPRLHPELPNAAGENVLFALARYPYLSRLQATRAAGYSPTSTKRVAAALTHLTKHDYLFQDALADKKQGTCIGVWSLLSRGRTWVSARGVQTLPRIKHVPERQEEFLHHVLDVNAALIALERFAIETDGVQLHGLVHDLYLQRSEIRVEADVITRHRQDGQPVVEHQRYYIAADGDVSLEAFGYAYRFWLEVDRGTEGRQKIQKKIAGMIAYAESLGDERLDFVIVAPPNPRREYGLASLIEWTNEHLAVTRRSAWAENFWFTDRIGSEMSASDYIMGQHWVRPGDDQLSPLIEGGGA